MGGHVQATYPREGSTGKSEVRLVPIIQGEALGWVTRPWSVVQGAISLPRCFAIVSLVFQGQLKVEDPTEGPKVRTACSAPSNPRVHKGTDNITRG